MKMTAVSKHRFEVYASRVLSLLVPSNKINDDTCKAKKNYETLQTFYHIKSLISIWIKFPLYSIICFGSFFIYNMRISLAYRILPLNNREEMEDQSFINDTSFEKKPVTQYTC